MGHNVFFVLEARPNGTIHQTIWGEAADMPCNSGGGANCPQVTIAADDFKPGIVFDGSSTLLNLTLPVNDSAHQHIAPSAWSGFTLSFRATFQDISPDVHADIISADKGAIHVQQNGDELNVTLHTVTAGAALTLSAAIDNIVPADVVSTWTVMCGIPLQKYLCHWAGL